jgi:hypothetical protein
LKSGEELLIKIERNEGEKEDLFFLFGRVAVASVVAGVLFAFTRAVVVFISVSFYYKFALSSWYFVAAVVAFSHFTCSPILPSLFL